MPEIRDVDIRAIVRSIFTTVLDLPVTETADTDGEGVLVTGCVHLSGAWDGSVTVECADGLARRATAAMFLMPPDEVADDDERDVVGELANMTGGNVKSALGGSCTLSLPSVTKGRNARISVPGTVVLERVAFDVDGERLVVTLLGKPVEVAGARTNGQAGAAGADR